MGCELVEGVDRSCGGRCRWKRRCGKVVVDDSGDGWLRRDVRREWIRNPEEPDQKAS